MEHPYLTHQTGIFEFLNSINMLFYIVCCAKMSTSGHLTFKNTLLQNKMGR